MSTQHDQVLAILEQFLQILGWPAGVDEQHLEMSLLQNGLWSSPERAYNWLFTQLDSATQKANPNAEFGMTYDTYTTTINAFKDAFETLTGSPDVPPDILRMAVDQQWTQAELTSFLQKDSRYSNPANVPWLQVGMTYKDVKNQFASIYGSNPTDPKQLASWFKFRESTQQLGTGQVAAMRPSQGPTPALSQSEVR